MNAMIGFMKGMWNMPAPVRAWVGVLAATNMVAIAFISHLEAQVALAALMLGAVIQAAIFSQLGFVRLLGAGHFHWIPMLYWMYTRLDAIRAEQAFYYWVLALFVINGISLIIDVVDVAKYIAGDRTPA